MMQRRRHTAEEWIEPLTMKVEEHITRATEVFQNLTEEQLLTSPADGGWSVAQCLEHLNSYGNYYLPAVERAMKKSRVSKDKPSTLYKSGWLGNYFTRMMQPETSTKYKAFKGHIPAPELDGAAVVAEFIHQQEQWLFLLRRVTLVNQLNERVPISISPFIRLKLGDVLAFVKAHDDRHIQQANRVIKRQLNRENVRS